MKIIDLLKLSTRMFKARTSRTVLTILGMGVGIGAILFLVSLGYGLQRTLLGKITTSDSILSLDVTWGGSDKNFLDAEKIKSIEKIEGVSEISPRFNINAQGKTEGLVSDMVVSGISPSFLRMGGTKILKGKSLNEENINGVIITNSVAQSFGKSQEEILGKKIEFIFSLSEAESSYVKNTIKSEKVQSANDYEIIGIIEGDENTIYVNSSTLDYLKIKKYDQLKVKCSSSSVMNEVRNNLISIDFTVSALSDAVDQAKKVFHVIQIVLGFFGVIALIVSAIGMFNTMTIALLERTREIGIMKSIGASDQEISFMFATEATLMGFLGAIAGVIMGIITGGIFNLLINLIASRFGGEKIELFYTPLWFIIMIIIFGTVVGFSTGVIPARRASKIDPLDALRNK